MAAPSPPHGRKLRAAIESVFRRTHGREMTPEERRLFGLNGKPERHSRRADPEADERAYGTAVTKRRQ